MECRLYVMEDTNAYQIIAWRKREIHANGWNEWELEVTDILSLLPTEDIQTCVEAMKANMLTGDEVIRGNIENLDHTLKICYYCDNLEESRGRIYSK